jgi:hypothetical protein
MEMIELPVAASGIQNDNQTFLKENHTYDDK